MPLLPDSFFMDRPDCLGLPPESSNNTASVREMCAAIIPAADADVPFHVLIVDDDAGVAEWIARYLKDVQQALPKALIEIVHKWEEAEVIINAEPAPSVVCLDLGLPGYHWELIVGKVREIEDRAGVVIITGHKREEVEPLLLRDGMEKVEVLLKDNTLFTLGRIVQAIVRTVERKEREFTQRRIGNVRLMAAQLRQLKKLPAHAASTPAAPATASA